MSAMSLQIPSLKPKVTELPLVECVLHVQAELHCGEIKIEAGTDGFGLVNYTSNSLYILSSLLVSTKP